MSKEFVDKNVFKNTVRDFYKKIFNSKRGTYNKDYERSDAFKALLNDDERRTVLYDYMEAEIDRYDDLVSRRQPVNTATVWQTGTNEELKAIVEANLDIAIIFDTSAYITNTVENRNNNRRDLEAYKKLKDKEEAEKKKLAELELETITQKSQKSKPKPKPRLIKAVNKNKQPEPQLAGADQKLEGYIAKEVATLGYLQLSPEDKDVQIRKVTEQLRYALETDRGYSLESINGYYSGTIDKKQRDEINAAITEIMEESDLGMTAPQYKTAIRHAMQRSPAVAADLTGAEGTRVMDGKEAPEYDPAVALVADRLVDGVTPSMTVEEQNTQLDLNFHSLSDNIIQQAGDLSMPRNIYNLMREYGVSDTIRDISNMILPALALTASGYKQTVRKRFGEAVANPIYVSQNLMQKGYRNMAKFLGGEPGELDELEKKEPEGEEDPERKEPERKEPERKEPDVDDKIPVQTVGGALSAVLLGEQVIQAIRGEDPITTKPVTSVIDKKIDNRPITITRERAETKKIGQRSEGGRRKYSPQIIYPDDEILEPTDRQLSRNEYNLAKFDFINPDNVGGNNSDGDNPLYKANDNELAIRYYDWKTMVIEKESEFVKQLPPKVSNKIIKQFRRSFVEPAEPRQTRLNYMIHDETQFAPFNSPYSSMTENTGTNPFIQNSVLFGSVP